MAKKTTKRIARGRVPAHPVYIDIDVKLHTAHCESFSASYHGALPQVAPLEIPAKLRDLADKLDGLIEAAKSDAPFTDAMAMGFAAANADVKKAAAAKR